MEGRTVVSIMWLCGLLILSPTTQSSRIGQQQVNGGEDRIRSFSIMKTTLSTSQQENEMLETQDYGPPGHNPGHDHDAPPLHPPSPPPPRHRPGRPPLVNVKTIDSASQQENGLFEIQDYGPPGHNPGHDHDAPPLHPPSPPPPRHRPGRPPLVNIKTTHSTSQQENGMFEIQDYGPPGHNPGHDHDAPPLHPPSPPPPRHRPGRPPLVNIKTTHSTSQQENEMLEIQDYGPPGHNPGHDHDAPPLYPPSSPPPRHRPGRPPVH